MNEVNAATLPEEPSSAFRSNDAVAQHDHRRSQRPKFQDLREELRDQEKERDRDQAKEELAVCRADPSVHRPKKAKPWENK
jgi:hypothetical protein